MACATPSATEPQATPAPEPVELAFVDLPAEEQQARLLARGVEVYAEHCARCHGSEGQGMRGAFPPLTALEGPCGPHERAVVEGRRGPMVVDGITYNSVMAPIVLEDFDVAAVVSHIRVQFSGRAACPERAQGQMASPR